MDYKLLIKNRRSIRNFTNQTIDPKILDEILHETCMAPSSSNTQPWRFIVITDPKIMEKISDESKKNLVQQIENNPNTSLKKYEDILRNSSYNVFYNAPCLILIVGQNNYPSFDQDCTLAAAYLMLAATEKNLGSCWIGLGEAIIDQALRKEIGLPDDYQVIAPIIVGYPTKIPSMGSRNEPIILKYI